MKTISILLACSVIVFGYQMLDAVDLPDGVKVGDVAPNFIVRNVDNARIGLETFRESKGIILVFTCNHCPFSKKYEDRIIDLHKKYSTQGWPVLAINPNDSTVESDDSFSQMQVRAKEKNFPFPYALDADQTAAMKYGARRTPHVFLLARKDNKFVVEYIGAIDDNANDASAVGSKFVESALDQLISGEAVKISNTKAIGCTIKWRKS